MIVEYYKTNNVASVNFGYLEKQKCWFWIINDCECVFDTDL